MKKYTFKAYDCLHFYFFNSKNIKHYKKYFPFHLPPNALVQLRVKRVRSPRNTVTWPREHSHCPRSLTHHLLVAGVLFTRYPVL